MNEKDIIPRHQKDFIFQQVTEIGMKTFPDMESGSACLQWMETGLTYLRSHGLDAIPACGSASFQLMDDDGVQPNYLSFEWQGDAAGAQRAPVNGVPLPEMHCYIWLCKRQEIVDFSVKYLPRFAKKIGLQFAPGFELPEYYWGHPNRLAPRAIYIPNVDATKLALRFMRQQKGMR